MKKDKNSGKLYNYTTGVKIKLIVGSMLLLALTLGFNTMLSLSSLENIYIDSTFSKYTAIGNHLERKIEESIRFGKSLDKFIGMNNMLEDAKHYLEKDNSVYFKQMHLSKINADLVVSIVSSDNKVLYSTNPSFVHGKLPLEVQSYFISVFNQHGQGNKLEKNYYKYKDEFYIGLPIHEGRAWIGSIVISLNKNQAKAFIYKVLVKKLWLSCAILLGVLLCFLVFFFVIIPGEHKQTHFSRAKIYIVMILILLFSQICFSLFNTNSFKNYYLEISREKTIVLGNLLREDIEYLLNKGIALKNLFMMEKMLKKIISSSPDINSITILSPKKDLLYMADHNHVMNFRDKNYKNNTDIGIKKFNKLKKSKYCLLVKIEKKQPDNDKIQTHKIIAGYILVVISKKVILSELTGIILDSITVLVISILFLVELLSIVFQYFSKQSGKIKRTSRINFTAIRPAAFLYFFGQTISVSFLPLYMEQLYQPLWGLSKDVVLGLPICATMLFGAISPLFAGPWVDKRGWHEPFFTGVFLTSAGFVYTWLAPDAINLIISRALVGFGYGLTFMAANGFVVAFTDENSKAQGLTNMVAGCYAGYICGSSTGGMLADRIGYNPVFIIGASIIALSLVYAIIFMKHNMESGSLRKANVVKKSAAESARQLWHFMTDSRILALCVFVILPSSMITIGFLNYFIPIYINGIGSTSSNIGRLLMIHGLFFIYIAPFFSRFIDKSSRKSRFILLSGAIGSLSLVLFYFYGGMVAAVLSVLILGLSGSFEASVPYALSLTATKKFGSAKAIAILSSVEKIGQVAGPLIFGWFVLGNSGNINLCLLGIAYFIVVLLFYIISRCADGSSAAPSME